MDKINSAVIGCGRMGAFTSELMTKHGPKCWFPLSHIEALQADPEIELIGISDINKSTLKKASLKYHIESCYEDYEELLRDKNIDILCVATRTLERTNIIKKAIESNIKALHIEKPLCNSMEQMLELENLTEESESILSYGTLRRYLDIYKRAKALVDSGKYGKLMQIQVDFGRAPLYWTHAHSVDVILFFADRRNLLSVQAYMSELKKGDKQYFIESDPLIDQASMYFDDDVVGTISKIPGMNVTLGCEKAIISVKSNGEYISISDSSSNSPYYDYPETIIKDSYAKPQGTFAAISSLKKRIQNQFHPGINQHIFLGQRVLFGFVQSYLDDCKKIDISDIDQHIFIKGRNGDRLA